ncbi:tumor necrosis factor receptor type 1-associated DEATH domain protein isoform X1 [Sphaerodactylus townsendi]|uniref:tumor necrosis factor receptor type 1-associated DEATH domain protein isoform X1 n=2 Tax=Sphaerodactylus townsendi TaxID=933632 RepID=UPI00202614E2|nr:tumor necrosis factor receptor type 1-associated DEATH domain protein isoform X1 [Sphaerodactylus townsendi]
MIPRMRKMGDISEAWVGSAYLFVQSTSENVLLPLLYGNAEQKPQVYRALKLAFADSTGCLNGVDMLKVHCSDPHLIVQLKFCNLENCRKFLQSYREGALRNSLQRHLKVCLAMSSPLPVQMELKTSAGQLDSMLLEEERCVECISQEKPNRLRDEEITKLEESLQNLSCQEVNSNVVSSTVQSPSLDSSLPPCSSGKSLSSLPQGDTFTFQGQQFANRKITLDDHQMFAKHVSKKWKQVGRSLQANCRALQDPTIDNIAMEYEREGLYEQAYQMLRRFIDSEGKRATIQRLIAALEDNDLISLAEKLLGIHPNNTSV